MAVVKVKYNNREFTFNKGITLDVIAKEASADFEGEIINASIDNHLVDLNAKIQKDCEVKFYDFISLPGNRAYERGLTLLFVKAVRDVINCDVKVLHSIDKGIYCEILSNEKIDEVTVQKIKIRIRELVALSIPIQKLTVSRLDAIDYFTKVGQVDKANSLRYISNSNISLYQLDNVLDYFYGELPNNTKVLEKYDLKYLYDNYVILLSPHLYGNKDKLSFVSSDKLLDEFKRNDSYLNSIGIENASDLNESISNGDYGEVIRVSEAMQNNVLFGVADNISKNKDIKIILITGPSSSGKTTVSKKLSLYLKSKGIDPVSISIDDFYVDLKDRILDENGKPESERIEAIDVALFNLKINELLQGKETDMPKYDFIKGQKEYGKNVIKIKDKNVLVIEGIHAFDKRLLQDIPDRFKFKIYLSPLTALNVDNHNMFKSTDNRLIRRMVRDNLTRGSSASQTLATWRSVRDAEEEFILPYQKEANAIFNTSLVYELGVLKTYVEPLLFSVNEDDPNYDEAIRLINRFRGILAIPSDLVPNDSIIREFIGGSCFKS